MNPERVGPYVIERKLGAGGMGKVYRARHAETGQLVAVKVLSASLSQDEGMVERFTREVEALKQLSNPHIVRLYESGMVEGTYYYAMEYVDGETLAERLRREKRLPWTEVIEISRQVCLALKAAHDAGVIHRDLKPSNLLIGPDGRVKLADFGIAQLFAARKLTVTGGVVGTAEFMSPEQAQGRRATKKSDLYSLGAVMYTMLVGRPPFTGENSLEVLQKHRFQTFDRPRLFVPETPSWLEEVVCQLLEKDPEKRFPDAYVLSRRLQEIPKKVQLSGKTDLLMADPDYDGEATTVAVGQRAERGPGEGTLIRDLMRAEIDRQQRPSPVSWLVDNTWFLLAALILIVAGGFYWLRPRGFSPEERFAKGVELMQQPAGDGWLEARDTYFQPLLKDDPEHWQEKIEPYLKRIERYELQRRLRSGALLRSREPPRSEAERFLRQAQHDRELGDYRQAEQTLEALSVLLAGEDEYREIYDLTQQLLKEVRRQQADSSNGRLLDAAMQRANRLLQEGQLAAARRVWSSVVALYGSDPAAAELVQQARRLLQEHPLPDNPSGTTEEAQKTP